METVAPWNPLEEWKHTDVDWVRVDISKEDLLRFTQRSYTKGLFQTIGFLAIMAATGAFSWWAFANERWILMVIGLYFHGTVYKHFGDGIHELDHGTVFPGKVSTASLSRCMVFSTGLGTHHSIGS
ncbi:MAG: hypothetical protein ACNA71_10320, partial [Kiritimatiellia bacterium]